MDYLPTLINAGIAGVFAAFSIVLTKEFTKYMSHVEELHSQESAARTARELKQTEQTTLLTVQIEHLADAIGALCEKQGVKRYAIQKRETA